MKPTGRFVALAFVVAVVASACTEGNGATGPTGNDETTFVPTPAATFTGAPGTAVYTYANGGLLVTVELEGNAGTMTVDNGTQGNLGVPDVYVLEALDGHRIEGEVPSAAPVGAGESATFDVFVEGITDSGDIGVLALLFGADNYGLFVRTG